MLQVIEIAVPVRLGDVQSAQRFVTQRKVLFEPGAEVDALRVKVAFGLVGGAGRREISLKRFRCRAEMNQAAFEILCHRGSNSKHVEDRNEVKRIELDLAGL